MNDGLFWLYIAAVAIFFLNSRRTKSSVLGDKEYLAVLDFDEWKSIAEIKAELDKLHGGDRDTLEIVFVLVRLENERLVEQRNREGGLDVEYRRRSIGRRARAHPKIPGFLNPQATPA